MHGKKELRKILNIENKCSCRLGFKDSFMSKFFKFDKLTNWIIKNMITENSVV